MILNEVSPSYYLALKVVTKSITLFKSDDLNSFANTSIFGNVFLNLAHGNTCGFKVIQELIEKNDHRDVYTIFHGLFTYSAILECIVKAKENNLFKATDEKEALSRITFTLHRYKSDLQTVLKLEKFVTEEGKQWVNKFKKFYNEICLKYADDIKYIKMTNQPYNFSLATYLQDNKL